MNTWISYSVVTSSQRLKPELALWSGGKLIGGSANASFYSKKQSVVLSTYAPSDPYTKKSAVLTFLSDSRVYADWAMGDRSQRPALTCI